MVEEPIFASIAHVENVGDGRKIYREGPGNSAIKADSSCQEYMEISDGFDDPNKNPDPCRIIKLSCSVFDAVFLLLHIKRKG
jgi:hypothetical protein